MAIVVEEKRNEGGIINLLIWLVVLGVAGATIYFVFFRQPELLEFTAAPSFDNVQQLSKVSINPEGIVNGAAFQQLKQYVTLTPPQNLGRTNPFLSSK